jgi:hypothetical protein
MKVSARYYPYPVLSHFSDDIVDSYFDADIDIKSDDNINYTFNVKFHLNNIDLHEYIHKGKACFAIHIECPNTRMRDIYKTDNTEFSFNILADKLNGKVEVNVFILANEKIENYSNSHFHEDYKGITFTVMKGDVLAVSEGQKFDAIKENDELKHIPSIFTVGKNTASDAPPLDVDMGQTNKLVIRLSKENFEYYGQLSRNAELGKIIASMILIPALVSLLEQIKSSDFEYEQYEDSKWFKSIEKRLLSMGYNIKTNPDFNETTIVIAQKLIGDPLNGSFKDLFNNISQG